MEGDLFNRKYYEEDSTDYSSKHKIKKARKVVSPLKKSKTIF
jgi:hypothetical protein